MANGREHSALAKAGHRVWAATAAATSPGTANPGTARNRNGVGVGGAGRPGRAPQVATNPPAIGRRLSGTPPAGRRRAAARPKACRHGMGQIEILIAIACFLTTILPIMHMFSFTIENSKVLYARAVVHSAISEMATQLQSLAVADIPADDYDLTGIRSGPVTLVAGNPRTRIDLSPLPEGYFRTLRVGDLPDRPGKVVRLGVIALDQPRADLELSFTFVTHQGGR